MPLKNGKFTHQEKVFVQSFASTGDTVYSGKMAGYAQPGSQASAALARPLIQAEVARLAMERLNNEILPLAIETHKQLLTDHRTPAGAKVQAVKLAYDRTLGTQEGAQKDPHEMTAAELGEALDQLKREKANRAKPILEHESAPAAPNLFD